MLVKTNEQVLKIEQILFKSRIHFESMGVNQGLLGLSLFYYYYTLYTQDEKHLNTVSKYLQHAINGLDEDYQGGTSTFDLIEISFFIEFLAEKGILDTRKIDFWDVADEIMCEQLHQLKEANNIDPSCGAIRIGEYFLGRLPNKVFTTEIKQVIDLIDKLSIHPIDSRKLFWKFNFRDPYIDSVELSHFHGMAGILRFLLSVLERGIQAERCKSLLTKGLNFLLSQKFTRGVNLFPLDATSQEMLPYQNLAYGDLAAGYLLLQSGQALGQKDYFLAGLEILDHSALFRDDQARFITDANLLYGALGIAAFFDNLKNHTTSSQVAHASNYWYNQGIRMNQHDTPWAGYRSTFNISKTSTQLSYAEGICGIGIAMMVKELGLKQEHLRFLNYGV